MVLVLLFAVLLLVYCLVWFGCVYLVCLECISLGVVCWVFWVLWFLFDCGVGS